MFSSQYSAHQQAPASDTKCWSVSSASVGWRECTGSGEDEDGEEDEDETEGSGGLTEDHGGWAWDRTCGHWMGLLSWLAAVASERGEGPRQNRSAKTATRQAKRQDPKHATGSTHGRVLEVLAGTLHNRPQ